MQVGHTDNSQHVQNKQLDFINQLQNQEILNKIDPYIKVELRQYYLMLLYGQKIPKKYNLLLLQNIKEILNTYE